ncbi:ABC transporter permease [Methanoregula sp.]|uniref:ABC transporter permease n=1 Tax=Methanoregula sp. TaxID=2052170 RepID=UPI00237351D1|nr:ABC transporter permease [Methanoregula sp.]MDD1685365.1 ABC transporter permease [Methanoregula sp.]
MTEKIPRAAIAVYLLLALALAVQVLVPDAQRQAAADAGAFLGVLVLLAILFTAGLVFQKKDARAVTDIVTVIAVILVLWEILLGKLSLLDPLLFPGPAQVFQVFVSDWQLMLYGAVGSLGIMATGYILALALAIPLGLYIGWRRRLYDVAYPIAKAVSPIPPTVYLPYAIVLLPTFAASSVFLIFIGAFWPILVGTIYGVFAVDHRIINSARTLGLSDHQMVRRILLPGAMPSIFSGAMISLIMAFISITVAEMIAATSGLGWYIEYNHQFANYDKVIAGMILIALVVIGVMFIFDRIQRHCLRWQQAE